MKTKSGISLPMLSSISGVSRSYLTRKAHQLGIVPPKGGDEKHILLTLPQCHKLLEALGKEHTNQATRPYIMSFINCFPNTFKTSTVINYAHYLRIRGYNVLCVDLDNKASMSEYYLGDDVLSQMRSDESIAKLLKDDDVDLRFLIKNSNHYGIDIIPSCYQLFDSELSYAKKLFENKTLEYWKILSNKFNTLTNYDVILIDTASVFNYLTVSAITESTGVIIPGRFNTNSSKKIKRQIGLIKGFYEDEPTAEKGIFSLKISLTDEQVTGVADKDQMRIFEKKYGRSILNNRMPFTKQFKIADSNGHSLFEEEATAHSHDIKKARSNVIPVFEELTKDIDKFTKYQQFMDEQKQARLMTRKAVF